MRKRLTTEEFIVRSKKVHGDKYDYSPSVYINNYSYVEIKCKKCGNVFKQTPSNHMRGYGCPNCKRLSNDEFIEKARLIHGNKFDYSVTQYKTRSSSVCIKCKECGEIFKIRAGHHLDGQGCPICWSNRMNTEKFIAIAKEKFGDLYDYSETVYINSRTKIKYRCPVHGVVEQSPMYHIRYGKGCPKCDDESKRATTKEFIENARKIHGDRYDYSLVDYHFSNKPVKIICKIHGIFEQQPNNHIQGSICPECAKTEAAKKRCISQEEFIRRVKAIHHDHYDFSQTQYERMDIHVTVICPKHGPFKVSPNNLLNGQGCPICSNSKGELRIFDWLKNHHINFVRQYPIKKDKKPKGKGNIIADFYIKAANVVIEFNGIQHYQPINIFGGKIKFKRQILRDKKEKEICLQRGLNLIVIPYFDYDNIEQILEEKLLPLIKQKWDLL